MSRISWEAARQKVIDGVSPLPARRMAVLEARGTALARPVSAREPMPPFDNAAMDGFAVRAADLHGATEASPVILQVVADRPAGPIVAATVGPGEAIRIMTGAAVPPGADAVVEVEATNFWDPGARRSRRPATPEEAARVEIRRPVPAGSNVRREGEGMARGATVLEAGHRVGGPEIGLLLSVGIREIEVHPLPRVGVLSTGNELVPPEQAAVPGQIPDSNRPALLGVLQDLGFPTLDLGLAGDDAKDLTDRILGGIGLGLDFLITSGGVSVGDYDLTRTVLSTIGNVESYQVAVKPGKPQLFGEVRGVPVFGLPGNPVSSLVVFDQFVLPGLKKRAGRRDLLPPQFRGILGSRIVRKPGRVEFLRVTLEPRDGTWVATSTGSQGSGVLPSMTRAQGYAILPEDAAILEAGSEVRCQFRGWGS